MPVIVIANPKGRRGQSTLSTNLAGYLAARPRGDARRRGPPAVGAGWLAAARRCPIGTWDTLGEVVRPPKGTTPWCWTRPPACTASASTR